MSIDTKLYINNKWEIRDIQDILKAHLGVDSKVVNTHSFEYHVITFEYMGEGRQMNVHSHCNTPLGYCTQLNLGKWGECDKILRTIADVIGGFYMASDYEGTIEMINGEADDNDKIPYFVKQAIIHNKGNTLKEIGEYIKEWHERIKINCPSDDSLSLIK